MITNTCLMCPHGQCSHIQPLLPLHPLSVVYFLPSIAECSLSLFLSVICLRASSASLCHSPAIATVQSPPSKSPFIHLDSLSVDHSLSEMFVPFVHNILTCNLLFRLSLSLTLVCVLFFPPLNVISCTHQVTLRVIHSGAVLLTAQLRLFIYSVDVHWINPYIQRLEEVNRLNDACNLTSHKEAKVTNTNRDTLSPLLSATLYCLGYVCGS